VFVKPVWCQCLWICKKSSIHLFFTHIRTIGMENICCYSKHESTTSYYFLQDSMWWRQHVWNIYCIMPIKTFFLKGLVI